jgi:hypothetical protein
MNNVIRLPIERTVAPVGNNPRHEFIFDVCDGLPVARQKRLVMRARSPEIGFIDDHDAETLIDALRLREA